MTHLLIAGHGQRQNGSFDPGATGHISKGEHRYVSEDLFPAMKKFLPKGHNVVFFDEYNVFDRGNIVALAKQYNADEVTEVHFDAASAAASGGHVIIYSGYSPDKMDLALRDAIKKMVGVRYNHKGHQGISGRNNLANVNRTANAGVTYRLIELGFGTNKDDAKVLTEDVETYAKELVKVITGTSNDKKPAKQSKKPSKPKQTKQSGYSGNSIVDYLNSIGQSSSFANRKKMAQKHGISNYTGTASQNTQLLNKLRGGSSSSSTSSVAKPTLGRNSRGNEVSKLQRQLNNHNPRFNPKGIDGIYGANTADAVLRYQKYYGVKPYDGIYGAKTANKLEQTK